MRPRILHFDHDLDVPGTEVLVDVDHSLNVEHAGHDIVLLPPPTACEGDPLRWSKLKKYWHLFLVSAYACVFSFGENTTGDACKCFFLSLSSAQLTGGQGVQSLL